MMTTKKDELLNFITNSIYYTPVFDEPEQVEEWGDDIEEIEDWDEPVDAYPEEEDDEQDTE